MKRFLVSAAVVFLLAGKLAAQNFEYRWQRVAMDTVYESSKIYEVDRIIADHQEGMAPLMEIVIHSDSEIVTRRPESALSNLAADLLYHTAKDYIKNDYPTLSLTNFGGIRNNFPKGAVRVYDVFATFPFDNSLVVVQLKGKEIRKILEQFIVRDKFEALGGIRLTVGNGRLKKCLVEGKELRDDAVYNLVTIDFLLDGGDRFNLAENALSITRTGIFVRDAAISYLKNMSVQGVVLQNKKDGRIRFE